MLYRSKEKLLKTVLCLGFAWLMLGADLSPSPPSARPHISRLFPKSTWLPQWKWEAAPTYFNAENLFDYINGSAELYLSYGFQLLGTANMVSTMGKSIIVDIYDMGSLENAFGVYSSYRNDESETTASIGTEALISPAYIRFYQGPYVVDLNGSDAGKAFLDEMQKAAQKISQSIPMPKRPPRILSLLPPDGLVHNSPKYIASGLLGYEFFSRGLEAVYRHSKDSQVKAFIVINNTPEDCDAAFSAFQQVIEKQSEEAGQFTIENHSAISGKVPYHQHGLAAKSGNYICGLLDLSAPEEGMDLIKKMLQRVSAYPALPHQ